MFIGHYGVAFALKKYDAVLSLGWLFLAVQIVDIFWTVLVFFGIEKVAIVPGITEANPLDFVHYPLTHSLVAFIVWSLVIFILVKAVKINSSLTKGRLGLLMGFAVFSHFLLDLIVHRPDIPLFDSDSIKMGLGLWNNTILAYLLESVIFIGGAIVYYKIKKPMVKSRLIGLSIFVGLLLILNLINLIGPPPNDTSILVLTGFLSYLVFTGYGFWLDKSSTRDSVGLGA